MNDVQRAAIARAEAVIAPVMKLYEQRNRIVFHLYRITDVLRVSELADLLDRMSTDDLRMALDYMRGLAEWGSPAPESPDAAIAQPGSAAASSAGG